jgi:hypothetical protein
MLAGGCCRSCIARRIAITRRVTCSPKRVQTSITTRHSRGFARGFRYLHRIDSYRHLASFIARCDFSSRKKGRTIPRCILRRYSVATCNGHQAAQPSSCVALRRQHHDTTPRITLLPLLPLAWLRTRCRQRRPPRRESWLQSLAPLPGCP